MAMLVYRRVFTYSISLHPTLPACILFVWGYEVSFFRSPKDMAECTLAVKRRVLPGFFRAAETARSKLIGGF